MWELIRPLKVSKRNLIDGRGHIFIAVSAGWLLSTTVRNAYPVLLPFLRIDYGLSLAMVGLLLSVLGFSYAIGQVPGGVLADRFGEGIAMSVSMVVAAVTLVLIVTSRSPVLLFVGTALLGGAVALFGVVRLTTIADVYPERVGTVHGLLGAVGDLGNTMLPPLVGIIAAVTVWQLGFGLYIPLFVLVSIVLWVLVPRRTSTPTNRSGQLTIEGVRHVLSALRTPSVVYGTLFVAIHLVTMLTFIGFYPTYLIERKGMSAILTSGLFAVFFAMGAIFKPLAGNAFDRIGVRRTLLVIAVVSGMGFAILPVVDGPFSLLLVTMVIGTGKGKGTIGLAYLTMSLPGDVQNTGLGLLRTIFFLLSSTSLLVFGVIADLGYFDEAIFLLAVLTGVSLVFVLKLPSVSES